jgi:hypothetical protein
VGQKLVTTHGSWSAKNLTFHYQWLADGKPISGATSRSFTPGAAQLGQQIRARVTATKAGAHSGTAKSRATDDVARGVFVNTAPPTVEGKAQVGVPLAANRGTFSAGGTFSYQWFAGGEPIPGATSARFTPTADQLGQGVKVKVTLSAPGYKTLHVKSDPTNGVLPGEFVVKTPPSVSGVAQVDQPLTASGGDWSPAGSISYQWLANGDPIHGATGTSYTPTPDDLRKNIAVEVTVKARGYDNAVATSTATLGVAPGTFLNTEAPSIVGTAQVGVPLTARKGTWTPRPEIAYQWLVDGVEIQGATDRTFTPRPQDLGKKVSVEVIATRPGYLSAAVASDTTTAVAPGVIVNKSAPVVSGRAVVGHTLRTTDGEWSIEPEALHYQWYAGSTAIPGATAATYQPTGAEAGRRIHVVVTARSTGYTPTSTASDDTARVVFGRVSFDKPTIRGHAIVGRTLTAHVSGVSPTGSTTAFRWYRDGTPIPGARESSYVVQPADLGHGLHVVVTVHALHWLPRDRRSVARTDIMTAPHLRVHTSMRDGRVLLRLAVVSPGIESAAGQARVRLGTRRIGMFAVVDGHGKRLLAPMRRGSHQLTVIYRGGPLERLAVRTVTVTVP